MKNTPKSVIVHCSATFDDDTSTIDVKNIREWHLTRGFSDVGYHYVITRSGVIQPGRPLDIVGAHCEGHNQDSVGICYVGTWRPSQIQIVRLMNLYVKLRDDHGIFWQYWHGHNEFTDLKTCPGFSMNLLRMILMLYDGSLPS